MVPGTIRYAVQQSISCMSKQVEQLYTVSERCRERHSPCTCLLRYTCRQSRQSAACSALPGSAAECVCLCVQDTTVELDSFLEVLAHAVSAVELVQAADS